MADNMTNNVTEEIAENVAEETVKKVMTIQDGDTVRIKMERDFYMGVAAASAVGVAAVAVGSALIKKGINFVSGKIQNWKEKRAAKKAAKAQEVVVDGKNDD
jgi:hypothetical protein